MELLFRVYQECEDSTMSHMVADKITVARVVQEHIRWSKQQQEWRYPLCLELDKSKYHIMLSTGMSDYNWQKIFHSDILKDKNWYKYLVEFKYWEFMATRERLDNVGDKVKDLNNLRNFLNDNKVTIVWNIYETPELLATV